MYRTAEPKSLVKKRGTPRSVLRTRWLVAGTMALVCAVHTLVYVVGISLSWWVILGLNLFCVVSLSGGWSLYIRHRKNQGRTRILEARRLKRDLQGQQNVEDASRD